MQAVQLVFCFSHNVIHRSKQTHNTRLKKTCLKTYGYVCLLNKHPFFLILSTDLRAVLLWGRNLFKVCYTRSVSL